MMTEVPLEGVTSEVALDEFPADVPVVPEQTSTEHSPNKHSLLSGPSWKKRLSSSFCCACGCDTSENTTPIHQVQPVILKPTNDIYLELKSSRRLRVIHIPSGGYSSNSPKKGQTSSRNGSLAHDESDTDSEEYWFDNADPKRPQIEAQSVTNVQQRRIFHKLAPQERPTLQDLTAKSDKNVISPGRLPRKKFVASMDGVDSKKSNSTSPRSESPPKRNGMATPLLEGDLLREGNTLSDSPSSLSNDPLSIDVPDLISNLNESNQKHLDERCESPIDSGKRSPKSFDVESPEHTLRRVVTIPNPGESSTDDVIKSPVSGSVVVTGSFLGGVANIGFEADEDSPDSPSTFTDSADVGYKRNRALAELTEKIEQIVETIKHPLEEALHPVVVEVGSDKDHEVPQKDNDDCSEKRPILFFIHGVGGSADSWQNQLAHFSKLGYEVIAPDLLGHGFSSTPNRPKAYVFTKLFRDVLTVFDHFCVGLGRQNPVVLIGHSYGSSIATAIARSRPDYVKVLVLIASGGPTALAPPQELGPDTPKFLKCLTPLLKCGFLQRKRVKAKGKFTGVSYSHDVPEYVIRHTVLGQVWPEGDIAFHRRITMPTLLVYGLKDGFVSLVEMCEMERTLPKAYLELIPMAGHHVMQDTPKELNAMMKKFVEKYQPTTST